MSATYSWRPDRRTWLVTVHGHHQRKRIKVDSEQTAKDLVRHVAKLELAGVNVLEALRRARTAAPAPVGPPFLVPRLRDALPAWITRQVQLGEIRHSTARAYQGRCRLWLFAHRLEDGRVLGELPVDAVTREQIGAVLLRIREAGRSRALLNSVLSPLRRYYGALVDERIVAVNPTTDLKRFIGRSPKRVPTRPTHFTESEVPRLLEAAAVVCPRWRPFVMTGCFAGLRWGESAALLWSDIDWVRGYIAVERTVSDRNRIEAPKDGEARRVKVSSGLLDTLRAHREAMALEGHVQRWSAESRAIAFPTSAGNRLAYAYFTGVWRALQATAGVERRPYKTTRHTFTTILLESGADIRFVQRQLGHATIGQTVDTYGHLDPERHAAVVEVFDRVLAEAPARHPAPPGPDRDA